MGRKIVIMMEAEIDQPKFPLDDHPSLEHNLFTLLRRALVNCNLRQCKALMLPDEDTMKEYLINSASVDIKMMEALLETMKVTVEG
mgnify:CR=1